MSTQARLDQILEKVKDPRFLDRMGQGNELGFFVFDYPPEDELIVRAHVQFLKHKLEADQEIEVIFMDLYEEILTLLEERRVLEKLPAMEEKEGADTLIDKLARGPIRPQNLAAHLLTRVPEKAQLIFLTGVGKAWPLLRSHTILNNLHHPLGDKTVILFFPGIYDQKELSLFGRLTDDNYYRAFRLVGEKA